MLTSLPQSVGIVNNRCVIFNSIHTFHFHQISCIFNNFVFRLITEGISQSIDDSQNFYFHRFRATLKQNWKLRNQWKILKIVTVLHTVINDLSSSIVSLVATSSWTGEPQFLTHASSVWNKNNSTLFRQP